MDDADHGYPSLGIRNFSVRSSDSPIVFMTPAGATLIEGYDLHRWLWHCPDADVRDAYRSLYRVALKVVERAVGDLNDEPDLAGCGLYLYAESTDRISAHLLTIDTAVVLSTHFYPFVPS